MIIFPLHKKSPKYSRGLLRDYITLEQNQEQLPQIRLRRQNALVLIFTSFIPTTLAHTLRSSVEHPKSVALLLQYIKAIIFAPFGDSGMIATEQYTRYFHATELLRARVLWKLKRLAITKALDLGARFAT